LSENTKIRTRATGYSILGPLMWSANISY